jgi:hypothetical protein
MTSESDQAQRQLVALLQLAYSGELAAALAYRGHWKSVSRPSDRERIHKIEREELHHRALIAGMLRDLGESPQRSREARSWLIGQSLGLLCHVSGWLMPMYGAGKLESRNVREYEAAARYAWFCGRREWVDCILTMAEVEWDHEAYFRANVVVHPLGRHVPIWTAPPPKEHIRASFELDVSVDRVAEELHRSGYTPLKAYWAYAFRCDGSLELIEDVWNNAGPWQWQLRDSAWYGDYLNARPVEGVRVRVHEFPQQASEAGVFVGPSAEEGVDYNRGFSVLLQIQPGSPATQADVDAVVSQLLSLVNAQDIRTVDPYD